MLASGSGKQTLRVNLQVSRASTTHWRFSNSMRCLAPIPWLIMQRAVYITLWESNVTPRCGSPPDRWHSSCSIGWRNTFL